MTTDSRSPGSASPNGSGPPSAAPIGSPAGGSGIDRHLLMLASVVILGSIMSILDTTIVNVALDRLGGDLHASLASVQWVATGYLLSLSMVIPLTGWAVERFGAKRVWMASTLVFLAGSALSGLSWSIGSLVAFRVLQGIGGGMIMPVGQTIMAQAAGPARMGRIMSILGVPMMLGPVLGPVLGGVLVQDVNWRWIFYVNLPIGALALFLAFRILPRTELSGDHRLDVRGFLLLSPGLALLVYGLSRASTAGGFGGRGTMAGIGIGVVLVAGFVLQARGRGGRALIDVRLFADRNFTAGAAASFLVGVALFGAMILMPLYYQIVRGRGALETGLLLIPQGIGSAMFMPLSGKLTDTIGAGKVVVAGVAVMCLGTAGFATVGAHTSYTFLLGALLVRGFGMGLTMMPAMAAAYGSLEHDQVPGASSTLNVVQRVGGSIGTALMAVFLQREMTADLAARGIHHAGGSLSAVSSVPPAVMERLAPVMAHAFATTFLLSLVLLAVCFVPAALLPRRPAVPVTPGRAVPPGHPGTEPILLGE